MIVDTVRTIISALKTDLYASWSVWDLLQLSLLLMLAFDLLGRVSGSDDD